MEVVSDLNVEWEICCFLTYFSKDLIGVKHYAIGCKSPIGNSGDTIGSANQGKCTYCNKMIPKFIKLQLLLLLHR